jgi:sugar transferase (PEP-CTERM/EpsH1 system associated)
VNGDILFLAHRVPYPPDRGDKMRSYHLLRALAGLARVHLATFADDDADVAHAEALRPFVARLHVERRSRSTLQAGLSALARGTPISVEAFASPAMHAGVRSILAAEPVDTIFAFSGQMAQFVPRAEHRFLMDFVDVDSAKFADYAQGARGPRRWIHAREARKLAAFEREVAARAALSLFVSDDEASLFRRAAGPGTTVATLENGIDLDKYDPAGDIAPLPPVERGTGPLIVFTGQMDYRPNVAGALRFATEVMPKVRVSRPDARFVIVGRKPDAALRRIDGRAGVRVTGAVADVRSWIAAADIVVAPLEIARGIQNKVLEGMAMARPVIASPAAFAGIDAVPGRDLIVAGHDVMAAAVLDLLENKAKAATIGASARALVERRYAWAARLTPLAAMVGRDRHAAIGAAA